MHLTTPSVNSARPEYGDFSQPRVALRDRGVLKSGFDAEYLKARITAAGSVCMILQPCGASYLERRAREPHANKLQPASATRRLLSPIIH
jgi:hypothetical protein